jgi:hypothetical protein
MACGPDDTSWRYLITARFNRRKQSKRRIQDGSAARNCCLSLLKNSVMHPHPAVPTFSTLFSVEQPSIAEENEPQRTQRTQRKKPISALSAFSAFSAV